MIQKDVTSHMSPPLGWSQRQRSMQSFALHASYNEIDFANEGLI